MSNLKPIGSEKLTGQNKLNRIMEIARFNEVIPQSINETAKSEYSVSLADGHNYQIVREKQGYIIKKTISESGTDYLEPMKNRKYYSSYSQAFKRLNLVAGELNRLNENEEGVSLYGEQKKFVLKTPKPEMPEAPVAPPMAPPMAPPAVPSPELPPAPDMGDEGMDMGDEGMEMGDEGMDMGGNDSEEQVSFKTIQKLTGKLTQKIRVLDNEEGMTSEDIKYVINMVLSSLELGSLSEEDKEDIMSKFEEQEEDFGNDMGGVYVGVNKAVGKHHWEVFQDEGRDSRIGELTTTTLRSQTEAAGDFDIEWANNPGTFPWQIQQLQEFRAWLLVNGFDPEDPTLTIGHPQVAQVDLQASFGTTDYRYIWARLTDHLDVSSIKTSTAAAEYKYTWSDSNYMDLQIQALKGQ